MSCLRHRLLQAIDTLIALPGQALKNLLQKGRHPLRNMGLIKELLGIELGKIMNLGNRLGSIPRERRLPRRAKVLKCHLAMVPPNTRQHISPRDLKARYSVPTPSL